MNRITLLPVGHLIGYIAEFVSYFKPIINTYMAM